MLPYQATVTGRAISYQPESDVFTSMVHPLLPKDLTFLTLKLNYIIDSSKIIFII